jgi:hypothetical protein
VDLERIPLIMRQNGWENGAALMDYWFNSPTNDDPKNGIPCTNIIKMNWVLTFPRAQAVYREMLRSEVWANQAAQREIISMLGRKSLLGNEKRTFGYPKLVLPLVDRDAVQYRAVGDSWMDMAFGGIDDLRAALGRFIFKIIVLGEVEPIKLNSMLTGTYKVTINELGIYVRDSYDFNDANGEDQSLGNWDASDNSVGRTMFNGGEEVKNSDFRQWRLDNNKGGDFIVFSDIKYVNLSVPSVFEFSV